MSTSTIPLTARRLRSPLRRLRAWLGDRKLGVRLALERRCAASRVGAALYYGVFSDRFWRECQATLAGRVTHLERIKQGRDASFLLRRDTHRLEKGLIMKPRKPVFALAYIEEAVMAFDICVRHAPRGEPNEELRWANDVLSAYFEAVNWQDHTLLEPCRRRFLAARSRLAPETVGTEDASRTPYRRDLSGPPPVSPEAFRALCVRRRSVRWFLDRAVPRELVDDALICGTYAPSACNRQPYRFELFDTPADVREVAAIPMGTRGFSENFPMIVVVVGELAAYPEERDRHAIYVDGALAVMGFALALETHGLSSCVINWPDIEAKEREIQRRLSLTVHERVVCLVAVGWPDPAERVPYSQKKELDDVRRYS